MEIRTTRITPFEYSKIRMNFEVTVKDKFDTRKQTRALMPNIIHSLDGTSLCLLYNLFSKNYTVCQFFGIHDCFATTTDKVFLLKTILASIYTDIYSNAQYLIKFDDQLFNNIEYNTNYTIDKANRTVYIDDNNKYTTPEIVSILKMYIDHSKFSILLGLFIIGDVLNL